MNPSHLGMNVTPAESWILLRSKITTLLLLAISLDVSIYSTKQAYSAEKHRPPNIVFILADDLGYADLGCFGQKKIKTPNLDQLAAEGMRLTQHYSGNAVCAPSRCVLMTGLHPGHAYIRNNRESKPEGQFPIPANTVTLARILQQQGYATERSANGGLEGGNLRDDHFARVLIASSDITARQWHTILSDISLERRCSIPVEELPFPAHQSKLAAGADPLDPKSYSSFVGVDYSGDIINEQALHFVEKYKSQPFFLYVPTTIPHLALQAPEDAVREYTNAFPDDPPYVGGRGYLPNRTPRATYAAMVTRMDQHVGALIGRIRDLGLEENTIYVFSSDNGPLYDKLGGTDCDFFNSAGPFRGRKGSLYEGGFREPAIVKWKGHIPAGSFSDRITGFEDWMPTLLELIGARMSTPTGLDGISFAATLLGKPQPEREFLYREFPAYGGQVAVRMGDWKGVLQNLIPPNNQAAKPWKMELYNLRDDIAEANDVSGGHPEIVAKMEHVIAEQHTPSAEFPFKALDERKALLK